MEFEHEVAMADLGVNYSELPISIKGSINRFKRDKDNVYADQNNVDPDKELALQKSSFIIAEAIQDWWEEKEEQTNNQNMSKPNEALIARAKAVGLPETATEAEIVAKETELASENKKKEALAKRAQAVGLPADASEKDIEAKEAEMEDEGKKKDALKSRAKAAGLAETASEAEIIAAETAKSKKPAKAYDFLEDELDL